MVPSDQRESFTAGSENAMAKLENVVPGASEMVNRCPPPRNAPASKMLKTLLGGFLMSKLRQVTENWPKAPPSVRFRASAVCSRSEAVGLGVRASISCSFASKPRIVAATARGPARSPR